MIVVSRQRDETVINGGCKRAKRARRHGSGSFSGMSSWHKRAVCPECGWHCEAPFGSLFHVHVECCPQCGTSKGRNSYGPDGWAIETMRWEVDRSGVVWWKPWTWFGVGRWAELHSWREARESSLKGGCDED